MKTKLTYENKEIQAFQCGLTDYIVYPITGGSVGRSLHDTSIEHRIAKHVQKKLDCLNKATCKKQDWNSLFQAVGRCERASTTRIKEGYKQSWRH